MKSSPILVIVLSSRLFLYIQSVKISAKYFGNPFYSRYIYIYIYIGSILNIKMIKTIYNNLCRLKLMKICIIPNSNDNRCKTSYCWMDILSLPKNVLQCYMLFVGSRTIHKSGWFENIKWARKWCCSSRNYLAL